MNKLIITIPLVILTSLIIGGLASYYLFPQEVEVEKIIYKTQTEKAECPSCPECPNQITPDCGTKPRMERHYSFTDEGEQTGSSYSNEPNECAKAHKRC